MNNTIISLREQTIGEIAAEMPVAIRVFEAWKIDYCCGGKRPLADALSAVGKSVEQFSAAINGAATLTDPAAKDWASEALCTLSAHVADTYHRYTREELATFAPLGAKVFGVHGERRPELAEVVSLVRELTSDMLPHMLKEEQILFPYVALLEDATAKGAPAPTPFFGTVKNPVRMMMIEHDRVGELMARLRTVTDNYTPPESACFSYRELYRRLAEFETRTHEHIHIENNIYFPRAVALEDRAGAPAEFAFSHACGTSSCA
ncbi:MAG: iron-sulfur cluster repair di-iron protein [Thermoanaerobaculia bacterium]